MTSENGAFTGTLLFFEKVPTETIVDWYFTDKEWFRGRMENIVQMGEMLLSNAVDFASIIVLHRDDEPYNSFVVNTEAIKDL